jgi:LEA14-like dessication related protein
LKKSIILISLVALSIVLIILGLVAYSYAQISASFKDVSSVNVELETLSLSSLIKLGLDVLSGNWLSAALDVIAGIELVLVFELTNNGLLPVYIPELEYDLSINGIFIGTGSSVIDATINPGEEKQINVTQNFQKESLSPSIESIINNNGIIDVEIKGVAYFELAGFKIPFEFESSQQVSIVDEIQKQLTQQSLP